MGEMVRWRPRELSLIVATLIGSSAGLSAACSDHARSEVAAAEPSPSTPARTPFDAGCEMGDEKEQRHGTDCFCCHGSDFGIAGSVSRTGSPVARIHVTDSEGVELEMIPNPFANFFRHARLTPPLSVTVFGPDGASIRMRAPAPSANCNGCHGEARDAPPIHGVD